MKSLPSTRTMQQLNKRLLSAFAIFFTAGDALATGAQCAIGTLPLQVKIFGNSHLRLGEPVALAVMVENNGRSEIKLPTPMEPYWYWLRLEVMSEQGKRIEWMGTEKKLIYS